MVNGFVGFDTSIWIPAQTTSDEINKGFIFTFQCLLERSGTWTSAFALRRYRQPWFAKRIEEELFAGALLY